MFSRFHVKYIICYNYLNNQKRIIGNKYIIDSALPESSSFTLVDTLHGITLFFIFAIIAANAYSLKLIKLNYPERAYRFDTWAAVVTIILYTFLNAWFIWQASNS